jgi:para-aminobenzoate synthetase/4-amino-4-deoxychorismate lyase
MNPNLFDTIQNLQKQNTPFLLLETEVIDEENQESFLFSDPIQILEIYNIEDYPNALEKMEIFLQKGYWLAGFFSYHFKNPFFPNSTSPLFSIGVYKPPYIFSPNNNFNLQDSTNPPSYSLQKFRFGILEEEYTTVFQKIKDLISQGKIYQLNYTFPIFFEFTGNSFELYIRLKKSQKTSYTGFYQKDNYQLLCFSPELFFRTNGNKIISRPMKGTTKLRTNEIDNKLKAENFMILDLLRNDIGKISKFGSVNVKDLLREENFSTLNQLTSAVEGELRTKSIDDIFSAIFPSGSITGAPKSAAMKYIHDLEFYPRGIYTGAMGYISPQKKYVFNILIRTLELNSNQGKLQVGSGIVWDSISKEEYSECLLKSSFFFQNSGITLLESILYKNGLFFFLEEHLERLERSANFFGYKYEKQKIKLDLYKTSQDKSGNYKVRILLFRERLEIDWKKIDRFPKSGKIYINTSKVESKDVLLQHKTTERQLYDSEYKRAIETGHVDCLFLNEKKQITEGCISNVFVKIGDRFYTPPLNCGVLPGVYRNSLLRKFPKIFKEGIIHVEDLQESESIFLCNSIRGIIRVKLNAKN